jgi:hypothetical protein
MRDIEKVKKIVLAEQHMFLDQLHSESEISEDEFYADMKSSTLLMDEVNNLEGVLSFMHFEMGYDNKDTKEALINLLAYNL